MSDPVGDIIPEAMAHAIADMPDLDEATCVHLLARRSEYLLSELVEHAAEAIAIANMQRWCARESARLKADLEAELAKLQGEMV